MQSPDTHGIGLTAQPLDPLRYDVHNDDPHEVAGVLRAMMPSGVEVLDVGCGTGAVTVVANRNKGNRVRGIEPDSHRAQLARSRGLDVYNGSLDANYVATSAKFDVVMFSDVLEHLPAPSMLLDNAMAVLKPGGVILASVPNVAHWSVRFKLLFGHFDYEPVGIMDVTHLRWFTEHSIKALFEERGLDVVDIRQTAGVTLPVYNRGLLRKVPKRFRSPAVRALNRVFPALMGCQHVIKATPRTDGKA